METKIVYFDESGDTGIIKTSSDAFVLTSCCVRPPGGVER